MRLMSTAVPIAVCLGIIAAATIGNDLAPLSTDLLVLDAEGHSATFAQEDPECKSYQTCEFLRMRKTCNPGQGASLGEAEEENIRYQVPFLKIVDK